jgi:hypothetical protein
MTAMRVTIGQADAPVMARRDRAISLPIVVMPITRSSRAMTAGRGDAEIASFLAMTVVRGHAITVQAARLLVP